VTAVRRRFVITASTAGAALLAFVVGRAVAGGIPTMDPLTYSGTLEDAAGAPLSGSHNLEVKLWDGASGGRDPLCTTGSQSVDLNGGHFAVTLPDACTNAVKDNADLWADVLVDGASLGRTKLGAVPYAVEAGRASDAFGALKTALDALSSRIGALEGADPLLASLKGTYPAVIGYGWGPYFCATATGDPIGSPLALGVDLGSSAPFSGAFGNLLFTNQGGLRMNFSLPLNPTCSAGQRLCSAPVTFFIKSSNSQSISVPISTYLDNLGAVYSNGTFVQTVTNSQTVAFSVPTGSSSLTFVSCSTDGGSLGFAVDTKFLDGSNGLSIDYDRVIHRNGN
jgi:hypothetical protein